MVVFSLLLVLSFFVFFACASAPPEPEPTPAPAPSPAPTAPAPAPPPQPPSNAPPPSTRPGDIILAGSETYNVVWGDTLTKISRNKYKNGFYYPLIMMASRDVIKDQDKIIPGMKLTIPNLQANLNDPGARESLKRYLIEVASLTERKRPRDAAGLRNLANSM